MEEPKQSHHSGLDDEDAFAETLMADFTVADTQQHVPQVENIETPPAPPAAEAAKQPPWAGKLMGHFKLLRLIGEGSTGMVIQAEDIQLKRIVALKVLRKNLAAGDKGKTVIEQFLREARAAAAIDHPNIVRVYEINQHAGWWYIAMEMITGSSLQKIIKAAGAMPASCACPIIADAAAGLQAAHQLGMIHRDIKPGNILVTRGGHGKLSDFGLVRLDDPDDPFDIYAHRSVGTPLYIAPEVIRRQVVTPAADIYSLGATLYHVLTGRPPYTGAKNDELLSQHLNAPPPNLQDYLHLSGGSPGLTRLIQRMMAKDPLERPSASEVAGILHAEAILAAPDTSATDTSAVVFPRRQAATHQTASAALTHTSSSKWFNLFTPERRTRTWASLILLTLLVLCAVTAVLFLASDRRQDRRAVARLFPDAPASYGLADAKAPPVMAGGVPAFSWKGKVDTSAVTFVASRSGRYCYPVDDPRTVLIRADQFIGYKNIEQALKDGKLPAPIPQPLNP